MKQHRDAPPGVTVDPLDLSVKWHRMISVIMAIQKARARDVYALLTSASGGMLGRADLYAACVFFDLRFSAYDVNKLFDFLDKNLDENVDLLEFSRGARVVHVDSEFSSSRRSTAESSRALLERSVHSPGTSHLDGRTTSQIRATRMALASPRLPLRRNSDATGTAAGGQSPILRLRRAVTHDGSGVSSIEAIAANASASVPAAVLDQSELNAVAAVEEQPNGHAEGFPTQAEAAGAAALEAPVDAEVHAPADAAGAEPLAAFLRSRHSTKHRLQATAEYASTTLL
jgi:hypothetical protein